MKVLSDGTTLSPRQAKRLEKAASRLTRRFGPRENSGRIFEGPNAHLGNLAVRARGRWRNINGERRWTQL